MSVVAVICRLCPCSRLHQLIRGLKYLLKVRYIIVVYPWQARFLIFKTVFLGRSATLPYVWKIYHKNDWHLRLVAHRCTKLSQNMYLINTHILTYSHARYDCKLWNTLWLYYVFFLVFSYIIINDHSCLNCYISTKLLLIAYLINNDMFKCQMWLKVMECLLILLRFCKFCTKLTNIHVWWALSSPNIHKLYICYNKLSDVIASYGTLLDFIAFFRYSHTLLTTIHV